MKLKDIFNIKNVSNFIEGHAKELYNNLVGLPKHTQEQILYRLSICADDCVPNGKCVKCGCTTHTKVFVNKSCNDGERFPDLMNKKDWEEFKKENNINQDDQ